MACLASVETGSFNFHGAVKMSVEKPDKRIEESQTALANGFAWSTQAAPQQRLYFLPLPQEHGAFLPRLVFSPTLAIDLTTPSR